MLAGVHWALVRMELKGPRFYDACNDESQSHHIVGIKFHPKSNKYLVLGGEMAAQYMKCSFETLLHLLTDQAPRFCKQLVKPFGQDHTAW